jgi:hypothetical protein
MVGWGIMALLAGLITLEHIRPIANCDNDYLIDRTAQPTGQVHRHHRHQ